MVLWFRIQSEVDVLDVRDEELQRLIDHPESERVERKASPRDREAIRKAICAFANDLEDRRQPGFILIGLEDDGSCADLTITDEMIRQLADIRGEGLLLPLPTMTVERRLVRNCDLLIVQVEPSLAPPVRLRSRTWVRVGSTLRAATPEEERRLSEKRRWGELPFDHLPVRGSSLDDLDLDLFQRLYLPEAIDPEVLRGNERPVEQQLVSMRFMTPEQVPTVAGVLVLAKDVRRWLPGAYVQFVRFYGTDLGAAVQDEKELDGSLPFLMRLLDDVLAINVQTSVEVLDHPVEVRRPDFPVEALRQLCRNAVMHRSYEATHAPTKIYWFSDRVEIHSPGGPYGLVNRENFGRPGITDYRNPQISEAMKVLGYVQRFGAGIPIARRELQKNGNPSPEFYVEATHVLAIVRKSA